jgi:D-alanyl-D-alanine carboxypeptidase
MKKIVSVILFCMLLIQISTGCGKEQKEDTDYFSITYQLQQMLNYKWYLYSSFKPVWGGAIFLYIICPEGEYFLTSGYEDGATKGIHFRGASTTKTFTAASIMLLHQNGLLNIDDHITDIIPGTEKPYVPDNETYAIPFKDQITIRLLLQHRAGVFDVSNSIIPETVSAPYAGMYYISYIRDVLGDDDHTFTFDELVGVVSKNNLEYSPPDTEFHYSNTGFSILGTIIERVSNKSYAEFVKENFLLPNGLEETSFPAEGYECTLPPPYVEGYLLYEDVLYNVTEDNMSPHVAEGNVITTPEDLGRWISFLLSGKTALHQQFADMMMSYQPTGESHLYYGLGITYTPGLGYGHNGGHSGYLTVMRYDPEFDTTLVIFSSAMDGADLNGELYFLYDVGYAARQILGYLTQQ